MKRGRLRIIDAHDYTIHEVLKNNEIFKIPHYQRRYSWSKEQLDEFWDDLIGLDEGEDHFFGTILLITQPSVTGKYVKKEVVDGQQRLTTILILLCVLRDIFEDEGRERLVDAIKSDYLYSRKGEMEKVSKLIPGDLDLDSYDIILRKLDDIKNIQNKNISDVYQFFRDRINESELTPKQIFDRVVYQLKVVLIETESERFGYRLFETMNDRGLPLTPVDLIKNYLLSVASMRGERTINSIKNLWGETIKNLSGLNEVAFFRRHLMSTKIPETSGKVTRTELYGRVKEIVEKGVDLEGFVRDIRNQSKLYSKICNQKIDFYSTSMNIKINTHLRNLDAIRASPSYTLILRAFRENLESGILDTRDIIEILKIIETFSIRRTICGLTTAPLDAIYNHLTLNSFEKENPIDYIRKYLSDPDRMPSDDSFKKSFARGEYRNNDQTKYILDTIEEEHFRHGGTKIKGRYDVWIEHIMPIGVFSKRIKRYESWKDYLGIDEKTFDENKNKIGNLTLLEKKPNIQASDKPFEEKKKYYTPEKTDMKMTHQICSYDDWGVDQIKRRSEESAEIAAKIWTLKV